MIVAPPDGAPPWEISVLPCYKHIVVEVDLRLPFPIYQRMFTAEKYSFLLDSAKDDTNLGQFSFVGGAPYLTYEARRAAPGYPQARVVLTRYGDTVGVSGPAVQEYLTRDVFGDVSELLDVVRMQPSSTEIPFTGGAVGYFGFECSAFVEDVPTSGDPEEGAPDIALQFVDSVLAKCHRTGRCYLSIFARGSSTRHASDTAAEIESRWLEQIAALENNPPPCWDGPSAPVLPNVPEADNDMPVWSATDRRGYAELVTAAQEHIAAGDVFEVCLTHRLTAPFVGGSAWELYQQLRELNPAPFAAYLSLPEVQVVSSSPERFLRVDRDGTVESRPIKGTRRRSGDLEQDRFRREDLRHAIKDRAENIMIVDLVRNDFGRVCELASVKVPELLVVEDYATVFQLVSTIVGKMRPDCTAVDVLKAAFPGGSMTGAPKIESLKIIDRLESGPRGIYSGTIGYFDHSGAADFNIVIRTVVVSGNVCHFHVGGAIVADSDPDDEYFETIDKARALVLALRNMGSWAADTSTPPWPAAVNISGDFSGHKCEQMRA